MESGPLLQTKLHRPRLARDLVVRTRLLELLDHDIEKQLILVCAPAGFGKTTLVSSWFEHMAGDHSAVTASIPAAWLSLDENDSDLYLFLHYFIASLRTVYKDACEKTLELLQAQRQPPQSVLYATLSNELEELPGEAILVLDDYHAIHGMDVHNLLNDLTKHWPAPLHLVLISRINPPIPLDNLRAKGKISEIRTRDLRFKPEETVEYLRKTRFALMNENTLRLLDERFEGWPAGLHLAALSMRSANSQEAVLSELTSGNLNITGYLVDEVLTHQIPAINSFLLKTSILDRFNASLCETVIGEIDPAWNGRACLDWIERSELFIIPLDDRREWYRYHHLFQEMLQQRLSTELTPDEVNGLHLKASLWFEKHGLIDEALQHALAAGDFVLASRQIIAGLRDVLNREDRPTLERWLRLLPEEMIQQSPELLMVKAWVFQFSWRLELQAQVIQQAEDLLNSEVSASMDQNDLLLLRGQIALIRGEHAYFRNQNKQVIALFRQALELLPLSWTFGRGAAMLFLGLSMQACGQVQAAERLLLAEYESYGDKADTYALLVLESLCFIYLNSGQLEQTRQIAQVLFQSSTRSGIVFMRNLADWYLGLVCYQTNELEAAAQHFSQIVENRYTAQITTYRDAVAGLALIHQIKGETSEAWGMVESISLFDLEQSGSEDNRTRSLRARLMLLQGDLEGAGDWVDTLKDLPPDQPLLWLREPQVTRTSILVTRGTDTDLQLALQILDVLYEITERTHNTRYKIEVKALRALALDALGKNNDASIELEQAVELARPGGFMRVFVDLGKPMQEMLRRLASQGHSVETIRRILAVFPEDEVNLVSIADPAAASSHSSPAVSTLVEPLTHRELEVLSLLRGPLSIKEIALELNISYATAKRHTINIYSKLDANQRWKAVARAEELKVLPSR